MSDPSAETVQDPTAIFDESGPFDPEFMMDAIQTLMRALPLEAPEEHGSARRRMHAALVALAAANPRDPIEVMLAVQAICAYQSAAACWRIGMNLRQPNGDSTRHISAAATAARTFDTMLRAIERRQAKPLAPPVGRPAPRTWPDQGKTPVADRWAKLIRDNNKRPTPGVPPLDDLSIQWSAEDLALADDLLEQARIEDENKGLDLAGTEGVRPDGSIVMPDNPTPQQSAYIARRLALMYKRERAENLRRGIKGMPKIRPLRTGDLVP